MSLFQPGNIVAFIKKYPLHILLLPLFFVLRTNNYFAGLVPQEDIITAFLYTTGGLLLACLLFYLVFRNITSAGIATTVAGCLFLFFGILKKDLEASNILSPFSSYKILLPILLLLFTWICYRLFKKKQHAKINIFLIVLLLIYIIIELILAMKPGKNTAMAAPANNMTAAKQAKPDIIYILADCYPSSSYQQDVLGTATNPLDTLLASKGFYVVKQSSSNYRFTPFSMASALNMDYLPWLDTGNVPAKPYHYTQALYSVKHARVLKLLDDQKYSLRNFSIFDLGEKPAIQKENFLSTSGQELIFYYSLYHCLRRDVIPELFPSLRTTYNEKQEKINRKQRESLRSYNKAMIDSLEKLEPGGQPQFVYTHLMMPHFPYFFDSSGNAYPDDAVFGKEMISSRERFKNYISYTNAVLNQVVEGLLQRFNRKAIIIIQSDHGLNDIPGSSRNDAFRNYTAYYFPDQDYHDLRQEMSNVNTFRIVFNKYFGQQLPLLADTSIYNY